MVKLVEKWVILDCVSLSLLLSLCVCSLIIYFCWSLINRFMCVFHVCVLYSCKIYFHYFMYVVFWWNVHKYVEFTFFPSISSTLVALTLLLLSLKKINIYCVVTLLRYHSKIIFYLILCLMFGTRGEWS